MREVNKDETVKRSGGRMLQVEKVQNAPGLVVAQAMQRKTASKKERWKIAGWSTKMLDRL